MKRRLTLARALVNDPELLLLDEPTTGLDPQARRELHAAIAQLKRDGCTILFTTHYLDEAEDLCDRVAILDRGLIVATGAPRDLIAASPALHSVTLRTSAPLAPELVAALPGAREVVGDGLELRFQTADPTATLTALLRELAARRIDLIDLQVRKASLEEVFLALTREAQDRPEAAR
jgi:ABC-2 type transport system ATP-binding protein